MAREGRRGSEATCQHSMGDNVVVRAAVLQLQDTILRTETIRHSVADRLALRREATKCVREFAQEVLLQVVPAVECKHRRLADKGADFHNEFHEAHERGRAPRVRGLEFLDDELATCVEVEGGREVS